MCQSSCQQSSTVSEFKARTKARMKERHSQQRKSPKPKEPYSESTHSTSESVDKRTILKRSREPCSPTPPQSANCSRVVAYKSNGELSANVQSPRNTGKHFQKDLVFTSTRYDNCSSPPAKIPVCNNLVYAGAKFHDPPAPRLLPKPPVHWFSPQKLVFEQDRSCAEMTGLLKVMLRVPTTISPQVKVQS